MTAVPSFTYGPAEVFVVRFAGDAPDASTLGALTDLIAGDALRLLDFTVVSRESDGSVRIREIDDVTPERSAGPIELEARGLTGNEDLEFVAEGLEPGTSAAIVVVELLWAKALAERFAATGSELLHTARVPAPELNELAALAHIG